MELGVFGFVDDAHAPAAEFFEDLEVGDAFASERLVERHWRGI
jgi:hypothetical protein